MQGPAARAGQASQAAYNLDLRRLDQELLAGFVQLCVGGSLAALFAAPRHSFLTGLHGKRSGPDLKNDAGALWAINQGNEHRGIAWGRRVSRLQRASHICEIHGPPPVSWVRKHPSARGAPTML